MIDHLYPNQLYETPRPKLGVVLGTYASAPYIELQLVCRKLYWPDAPLLVSDDSSPDRDLLKELCGRYDASFISTPQRFGHTRGDMAVFVNGFTWAAENNIDILVKISRRFIFTCEWTDFFQKLASSVQYPTYSNPCSDTHLPLRSECMAMHVKSWMESDVYSEMQEIVKNGISKQFMMEHWCYDASLRVYDRSAPDKIKQFDHIFSRSENWQGYGLWPLLGYGRFTKSDDYLWHDVDLPEVYLDVAKKVGLTRYSLHDFRDPNHGEGRSIDWMGKKKEMPAFLPENAAPREYVRSSDADFSLADSQIIYDARALSLVTGDCSASFTNIESGIDAWKARVVCKKSRKRNNTMPYNSYKRLLKSIPSPDAYVRLQDPYGKVIIGKFSDIRFMESITIKRYTGISLAFITRRLQDKGGSFLSIFGNCNGFIHRIADYAPLNRYILIENNLLKAQAVTVNVANNGPGRADVWHLKAIETLSIDPFIERNAYDDIGVIKIDIEALSTRLLKSGLRFLREKSPELVFEFNPDVAGADSLDKLIETGEFLNASLGYDLNVVHEDGSFSPFPGQLEPRRCLIHACIAEYAHVR